MNPIDVHVLHLPGENEAWRKQCDDSLVGHPINIHHIDGVVGDMRRARGNGFSMGTAPYVSFVDPDDFVSPNAFEVCLNEIQQYPDVCGVYTLSNVIHVGDDGSDSEPSLLHPFQQWPLPKKGRLLEIHQLVVMKRELVQYVYDNFYEEIPRMQHAETWVYWTMAQWNPWRAVDFVGYNWRIRKDGAHNNRVNHGYDESMKAAKYVTAIRHSLFS